MIDVRNIYKTFTQPHEVKALVDVSTKIEPGEVIVVCGPSGSGKSTYLRCLNRLEAADSGQIIIDGIDVRALEAVGQLFFSTILCWLSKWLEKDQNKRHKIRRWNCWKRWG